MMEGSEVLWMLGLGLAFIGEIWAFFSPKKGDTITENVMQHWFTLSLITSFFSWGLYHFTLGEGVFSRFDFLPLSIGFLVGLGFWRARG